MASQRPRIGGVFGLVGLIAVIIAMISNNITGYEYTGVLVTTKLTCRWATFDLSVGVTSVNGIEYSSWCDSEQDADVNGDWCQQMRGGQTFIAFLLITTILSLIAVLSVFLSHLKRVQGYVKWLFLVSAIFCIIAVAAWIGTSDSKNLCYDTDLDGLYWGASLIMTVIAIVMYIIAFALTFQSKEGDYETLL